MKALRRPARFILLVVAGLFAVSFFLKDNLPGRTVILETLLQDPVQTDTDLPGPFDVTRKGVIYTVSPFFNYELWGMIVSYHHANSFVDISHKMWNDHVNAKDLCVVWGKNVETAVYRRMKFKNRDFTCFYSYPDEATGKIFTENCLSNNHILPADSLVARAVMSARRGDQIHLKGWLVSYGQKGSPYKRLTSTTRADRGNGACETIFVTDFEILRRANAEWRFLHSASLILMIICAAFLLFT
jgi:hypothetical protein